MPGQRRLAFKSASQAHRPDLHRLVPTAASQLAILAPCHRRHTVIAKKSPHESTEEKTKNMKKNPPTGVAGHCRLTLAKMF